MIFSRRKRNKAGSDRIVVLYYSLTGNTEKLALIIASEIHCEAERVDGIFMIHSVERYGRIIIGTPIWNLGIPAPMTAFLISHNWRGVRIWPFYTSGGIFRYAPDLLQTICVGARIEKELVVVYGDKSIKKYSYPSPVCVWCVRIQLRERLIK